MKDRLNDQFFCPSVETVVKASRIISNLFGPIRGTALTMVSFLRTGEPVGLPAVCFFAGVSAK